MFNLIPEGVLFPEIGGVVLQPSINLTKLNTNKQLIFEIWQQLTDDTDNILKDIAHGGKIL